MAESLQELTVARAIELLPHGVISGLVDHVVHANPSTLFPYVYIVHGGNVLCREDYASDKLPLISACLTLQQAVESVITTHRASDSMYLHYYAKYAAESPKCATGGQSADGALRQWSHVFSYGHNNVSPFNHSNIKIVHPRGGHVGISRASSTVAPRYHRLRYEKWNELSKLFHTAIHHSYESPDEKRALVLSDQDTASDVSVFMQHLIHCLELDFRDTNQSITSSTSRICIASESTDRQHLRFGRYRIDRIAITTPAQQRDNHEPV